GREPVLLGDGAENDHAGRVADAPVRPGPGVRREEALLGGRGRDGKAARQGRGLVGSAPGEGGDRPPLPALPAEPVPDGAGPARPGGGACRGRGGRRVEGDG